MNLIKTLFILFSLFTILIADKATHTDNIETNATLQANQYDSRGLSYLDKGEYDKALEFFNKSLQIKLATIGENNPTTATSYNNIGSIWKMKGKYDKAIDFHNKALKIQLATIGENNSSTATSYSNIGMEWFLKGENDKAMEFYNKALKIQLITIGEKHPETLKSYYNIGMTWSSMGEYYKEISFYHKILKIKKNYPDTQNNLAYAFIKLSCKYKKEKNYTKAIDYYNKALLIHKKLLPSNPKYYNDDIFEDIKDIINIYQESNQCEKAKEIYDKSLNYYQKLLKEDKKNHAQNYIKMIIKGVEQFNLDNNRLDEAKEILATLPDSSEKKGLLLQIKELEGGYGIYILILLILFFGGTIFYIKRYRHPLVLDLSTTPTNLLTLAYSQLPQATNRLNKINRLETTLTKAGVSQKILENAIAFNSKEQKEQITTIAQRVTATLEPKENYYELKFSEDFPLSVERLSVIFLKSSSVIDVKDEVRQSGILEGRIVLLLGDEEFMRTLHQELTSDKTNMWASLLPSDLTKLLLSPKPKEVLAEIISSQIALTQISPYQIGGGVNRESIFFGRERIISHILNKGVSNYIIIGGRQVGKSSLLKAIERRYEQIEGVECYYISASNENLIEDIKLELDQEEMSDKAFARFINTSSKQYLFLIDEADDFVRYEQGHEYSGLKFMRSLSEKNNASFILAGFWEIYRYTFFDYQSPLKNFASIFEVEELEYEACMDLATKPMQSLGLGYENREDIEWMIQWLGQRANLIQIVCDYLVENIDPTQKRITKNDITNALQNEKLLKFFDDWNDMSTDNREKWIDRVVLYGTIERERFNDSDLQKLIRDNELKINNNELDKSLVRLRLGYIIKKVEDGYAYRVPLFIERILRENVEDRFLREVEV